MNKLFEIRREYPKEPCNEGLNKRKLDEFFNAKINDGRARYLPHGTTAGAKTTEYRYFMGCVVEYRNQVWDLYNPDQNKTKVFLKLGVIGMNEQGCRKVVATLEDVLQVQEQGE